MVGLVMNDEGLMVVGCSFCGGPTQFFPGSLEHEWYLCDDCEGTEEAAAAGYTHHSREG